MESNYDHKIYKYMTKRSALDVTPNLTFRTTNQRHQEQIYKGSLKFSISDKSQGYAYAYLDKSSVKMIMRSIIEGTFDRLFPLRLYPKGFVEYGGSDEGKGGDPESRILSISKGEREVRDTDGRVLGKERQYVFTIMKGKGRLTRTNSIQMVGTPETRVQSYVSYHEAVKMAHEILDYISSLELSHMMMGEPLVTWKPKFVGRKKKQETVREVDQAANTMSIPKGQLKGKQINQLTEKELILIYNNLKNNTAGYEQIYKQVKSELKLRLRLKRSKN